MNKHCPEGGPDGILQRNKLRVMASHLPVKALLRGDEKLRKVTLMKKATILFLSLALMGTVLAQIIANPLIKSSQGDDSIPVFWEKFKAAVIKGDKALVADLSQFPISMPYGLPTVRTRSQFTKRYRDVFSHETDAAKCFSTANPQIDPARPKQFTVACKNAAGDEVIVYSFARKRSGWRFTGLDNINE